MNTALETAGQGAATGETATCEAIWAFIGAVCGEPAVGRFTRMCVHEHSRTGLLCRDHADRSENGICRTCWELPGDMSHACPVNIAEVKA
jgi:hypothetical protein